MEIVDTYHRQSHKAKVGQPYRSNNDLALHALKHLSDSGRQLDLCRGYQYLAMNNSSTNPISEKCGILVPESTN
jgi:hypothetical protein